MCAADLQRASVLCNKLFPKIPELALLTSLAGSQRVFVMSTLMKSFFSFQASTYSCSWVVAVSVLHQKTVYGYKDSEPHLTGDLSLNDLLSVS